MVESVSGLGRKFDHVYLPDSSPLMHDAESVEHLGSNGNAVVIYSGVIDELDRNKTRKDLGGYAAREASRKLMRYRQMGKSQGQSLKTGVLMDNGGWLFVDSLDFTEPSIQGLSINPKDGVDVQLICLAMKWKRIAGSEVIVVSRDFNQLMKADAFGVEAEDYEHDNMITSIKDLYSGVAHLTLKAGCEEAVQDLHSAEEHLVPAANIMSAVVEECAHFYPNQCCYFYDNTGKRVALAIYKKHGKDCLFRGVRIPHKSQRKDRIAPLDDEQAFAFALLRDPEITTVSLVGIAGTGKTLLSLAVGCEEVDEDSGSYDQVLIYRPMIEIGGGLGFYPGTKEQKFAPWTEPIIDNMQMIEMHMPKSRHSQRDLCSRLQSEHKLRMEPLTHVRGRSVHNTYMLVEEVQNIRPKDVKTLITRKSGGSKIVLNGDPSQIDDPASNEISNGLVYTVERLKGEEFFGHIVLTHCHRPADTQRAAELL